MTLPEAPFAVIQCRTLSKVSLGAHTDITKQTIRRQTHRLRLILHFWPLSPSVTIDMLRWVAVAQSEGHVGPFVPGQ